MVDIKRQDITLSDRTKGISADEFAWGSYFYSEAISSWYNTKGFELGYRLSKTALNNRSNGYAVALSPAWGYGFSAFTRDGRIEMEDYWNGEREGAYYAFEAWGLLGNWYLNGVTYWDYFFAIRQTSVDKIHRTNLFDEGSQLLTNTDLSDSTGRTFGTWRTATTNGAAHTIGETDTLVSDAIAWSYTATDRFRLAVKVSGWTAWSITVKWGAAGTQTFNEHKDGRYVANVGGASTTTVTITPTGTFDGIIEEVKLFLYDDNSYSTITTLSGGSTSDSHPALVREWDLYIACGSYINIINLSDSGLTSKQLIDRNYKVVAMNQQAGNIIIRATDGYDSRQYYRNGVDAVATEVIEWKGLIIQSACGTETLSYVLTTSGRTSWAVEGYEYRLYAVSGYQRNLIASKLYQFRSDDYLEADHYNENKKFDFNDVTNDKGMTVFLDSLYIPGCDWVYKYGYDIPWLRANWIRPIKYDTGATNIVMGQRGHFLGVAFTADWVNYIGNVDNRVYPDTWFLVTESIYRDKLSTRKALEKLKIWYKNVASTVGNIKVYAIVDDTYFWRFRPTATPTTRPEIGDVYTVANNTTGKVIDVDKTNGVITFVTVSNTWSRPGLANTTLTKISGEWDNSITVGYNFDNMCLIKTIESENQGYGSDLIFWKNFVNNYIPYRHKIQFVIELNSNSSRLSPEIYEISMVSDITDVVL